jgi:hypothetical protein
VSEVEGKTPGSAGTGPGAVVQGTEGSRLRGEVVVIWLMSLDELRRVGPLALRPWLERRMRTLKKGPAQVVTFETGWHQETRRSSEGGN